MESAAGAETTEILVTVEGHHEGAGTDVAAAVADLEGLLATYVRPATLTSAAAATAEVPTLRRP
jgi:hypothetical protein